MRDTIITELENGNNEALFHILGLTQEELSLCLPIVEDLFEKMELVLKGVKSNMLFSFIETKQFLENQAELLEEFQRMGLSSEDTRDFLNRRKTVGELAFSSALLMRLGVHLKKEIHLMIPWIERHMGKELSKMLLEFPVEFATNFESIQNDIFGTIVSFEKARDVFFQELSDRQIPLFLGSLFLSGLYTIEQIQEVISYSLEDSSWTYNGWIRTHSLEDSSWTYNGWIRTHSWIRNPQLLIRFTELAQQPNRAECLLSNPKYINAEIITTVLSLKSLTPEIVSKLFNILTSDSGIQHLSAEERNIFIQQILEEHEKSIPTPLLTKAFLKYDDAIAHRIIRDRFFSRLVNEESNALVKQLLLDTTLIEAKEIDLALRSKGRLSEKLASRLLKNLIWDCLFPSLGNEDRIKCVKQLLRQHAESFPSAFLRELFWKPKDPSVRELVNEILAQRETRVRQYGRELLHTAYALSYAGYEGLDKARSVLEDGFEAYADFFLGSRIGAMCFLAAQVVFSFVTVGLFVSVMEAGNQDL